MNKSRSQTQKSLNFPPIIEISTISMIRNKHDLLKLELKYDNFLSNHQQLLFLNNLIEEYLDIRDALTIQRQRMEREEKKRLLNQGVLSLHYSPCKYEHNLQNILPDDLKLSQVQLSQGYMPCPNEPKEFKCGCETIKYVSRCECRRVSNTCKSQKCNEKIYPILKLQSYCITHHLLFETQKQLEQKLINVKKELSDIKRHSNRLDYDDNNRVKRISRYPWKNL